MCQGNKNELLVQRQFWSNQMVFFIHNLVFLEFVRINLTDMC